ncbi:MAG: hypothetical protein LKF69_02505 [Bacilli bacterium]|jgi:hypothetical protein|nr:hypothetical protein [Bacilli bacterium]MCH4202101.1 hypothetical protein [Bacilli bacterium]MCH4235656.1 hypothetical protein [Bacilli bacterium]
MTRSQGLFYNLPLLGDVLRIKFFDQDSTRKEKKGKILVLFNNDEIIGYEIYDLQHIIKIKSSGLVILPPLALIEVLNSLLEPLHLPLLTYSSSSGFVAAKVVSTQRIDDFISNYTLELGQKKVAINSSLQGICVNDMVVVAVEHTTLANGHVVGDREKEAQGVICCAFDLGFDSEAKDTAFKLDASIKSGEDIFQIRRK